MCISAVLLTMRIHAFCKRAYKTTMPLTHLTAADCHLMSTVTTCIPVTNTTGLTASDTFTFKILQLQYLYAKTQHQLCSSLLSNLIINGS